ncbi:hypothetical protein V3C99_011143 [Haemonchus contortus]
MVGAHAAKNMISPIRKTGISSLKRSFGVDIEGRDREGPLRSHVDGGGCDRFKGTVHDKKSY